MAVHEEIIIDVVDNGMAQATDKANAFAAATKKVTDNEKEKESSMKKSANAVLENGGAMGLLNDVTGGYAMMVKDAVEASALFSRGQKAQAATQKAVTVATASTTTGMKLLRIALIGTGIGAIVVAVGLLIANFDKVKKAVMSLMPIFGAIAKFIGSIVDAVTDFVGITSDATRAIDKMVANSEASLKKNEHFLEANGDKFDQYTQRKLRANIDYNKKVKELAEDEELTDREKMQRMQDFREKANREILKADADRQAEQDKKRKEAADKEAEAAKKIADAAEKARQDEIAKEKERVTAIAKILDDYRKKVEDANAKSDLDKINLEEARAMEELNRLKATEEEKAKVRTYYDELRIADAQKLKDELAEIEKGRQEAERDLELDQKEWEIENETDPIVKLRMEKDLLQERAETELERLQADIDNARLSATERANAEASYAKIKQDLDQSLSDKDTQLAEEQKTRDEAVANNRENIARSTAQTIMQLAGESSAIAKGVAVAQTTIDTIQSGVSAFKGMVSAVPGPVGIALGAVAAAGALASGYASVKKILATKPVEKSAPNMSGAGSPAAPAAPSVNLVQGTGANQIAEAVAGQNTPIQAYVVSGNVTSAQSLDRNIVDNSTL